MRRIWGRSDRRSWKGAETALTDRPHPVARPRSVNAGWVNLLGLAGFLAAVPVFGQLDLSVPALTLLSMLATAAPMVAADLAIRKVHRRPATGLVWEGSDRSGFDAGRVTVKLLGLAATLLPLAIVYAITPEYQRDFYHPCREGLRLAAPWVAPLVVVYFALVDARMARPRDCHWMVGAMLIGRMRWRDLTADDRHELLHHGLGWVIKGFFLPLMFVYLGRAAGGLAAWNSGTTFDSMRGFVAFICRLSLAIDLAFVVCGYCLTLRLIDAHIRTANPLMYGWVFTVVLYQPFWAQVGQRYFKYSDGTAWYGWLDGMPVVFALWGLMIVLTRLGWAWANLSFGCRFSNLTHRGIITNGPYRWSKHPSYLLKNVSWWLLSMPFLAAGGPLVALKHSLMLLGVNVLYFVRARAEEQHLSEDPVYVTYAEWVNQHGVLAWLGRIIPFFRYRPPH